MGNNFPEGIFGDGHVVNEATPDEQAIADYFLGYTDTPPDVAEEPSEPTDGDIYDENTATEDKGAGEHPADKNTVVEQTADSSKQSTSQQAASTVQQTAQDPAAAWQMEKQQYEQALQYMAALLQKVGALPPVPGAAQVVQPTPQAGGAQQQPGLPPTVQQIFGLPMAGAMGVPGMVPPASPFVPNAGFPAFGQAQPTGQQQTAAQPAASEQENEEDLDEQFYTKPSQAAQKVAERVLERKAQELVQKYVLPQIAQREAFFGQVMGQILTPVFERIQQYEWATRVAQEYHHLMEQHGDDFAQAVPEIQAMLREDPNLMQQFRYNPQQVNLTSLYAKAKERLKAKGAQPGQAQQQQPPKLQAVPGGKGAARMPQAGAARVRAEDDNDALVEAALGPVGAGGLWE